MKGSQLLRAFVSCFLILVISGPIAWAQESWEPLNGPYLGRVFALCLDGSGSIIAGTESGGLFSSSDNGDSWTYADLSLQIVRTLYRHSNGTIYAGLQNGLMVSTDDGVNWEQSTLNSSHNVFGLTITSTGVIYAGGWQGLERSTDGGASFEIVELGAVGSQINELCLGSNDAIFAGLYNKGLIRSVDNGQTWTQVDPLFENKTVNCVIRRGGSMFAAVSYVNVFRSTDNGTSWTPGSTNFAGKGLEALYARDERELWAGTDRGLILHSTDSAATWTTQFTVPDGWQVLSIVETPDGSILAGTDWGGIYKSTDDGATWYESDQGLSNVIPNSPLAYAMDSQDNMYFVYRGRPTSTSTDGGDSWRVIDAYNDATRLLVMGAGDILYAARRYDGVWHTSDKGTSWIPDTTGLPEFYPVSLAVNPQGDIALGGEDGILYLREAGATTWEDVSDPLISSSILCLYWENGTLFAGTYVNGLYRTLDKGGTWAKLENGIDETNIYTIVSDHAGGIYVGGNQSLYYSSDNGDAWTDIGQGISNAVTSIAFGANDRMYAGTAGRGVFTIAPPSSTWTEVNQGLPNGRIETLLLGKNGMLYAGTYGNGLFRMQDIPVSVEDPVALTGGAELHSAFPNPFTSTTQVSYALPAAAHVRIAVYDMTGREVALLVDGLRPAGAANAGFDASGLAPGMYLCKMSTGARFLTQPLMLLK
jgi:photosystem II stability/assembly factor-like uncharacterized protein